MHRQIQVAISIDFSYDCLPGIEFIRKVDVRLKGAITVAKKDLQVTSTNYQIEYRKSGTSEYAAKYTDKDATSYVITGLDAGQQYDIRVQAAAADFFTVILPGASMTASPQMI